jgi:hypothetical protein
MERISWICVSLGRICLSLLNGIFCNIPWERSDVGGTVTHLTVHASLHQPYEHEIMISFQLCNWYMDNIKYDPKYITFLQYKDEEQVLQEWLNNAHTSLEPKVFMHLSQSVQAS